MERKAMVRREHGVKTLARDGYFALFVHGNGFTRIDLWELENTMLGKKSCARCGGEWMKYEMRENSDHQADLNIYIYTHTRIHAYYVDV